MPREVRMSHSGCQMMLTHCSLRRMYRRGACPLLEVKITYPRLCPAEDGKAMTEGMARFNEAYGQMAEGLMGWAEGTLCPRAEADFEAEGAGAAYRFDRRVLTCRMDAALSFAESGEITGVAVTRTLCLTTRHSGETGGGLTATDLWRGPELTLRRAGDISGICRRKNSENEKNY